MDSYMINWAGSCFARGIVSTLVTLVLGSVIPSEVWAQDSHELRIALFKDVGVGPRPELADTLAKQKGMRLTVINGDDIRGGALNDFDVFIAPGGSGQKEANSIAASGADEIRRFVKEGGKYIGICAGCYLASSEEGYIGLLPLMIRDRKHWRRGQSRLPVQFSKEGAEVFGLNRPKVNVIYHNGPILDCREMPADVQPLAVFRAEVVAEGGKEGIMKDSPAIVLGKYGKGSVLGISPHFERTPGLEEMIPHAIRWLTEHGNSISR